MRQKRVLPDPVEPSSSRWRSGSNRYLPLVKPYAKPRALGLALPSHVTEPLTSPVPVLMRALPRTPPSSPHPLRLLHREEEQRDEEEQCERGCGARRMGGEAARQPPVGNGGEIESGDGGDGASAQKVIHWPGKCRAAKCPECQSADEGGDEDFHFSP